jgi:tetratricopeptide (TPR) repeat protein
VKISAVGDEIVVRDDRTVWNPESGQTCFDFDVAELAEATAPLVREAAQAALESDRDLRADEWFELACELEASDPQRARDAYSRVIALDPRHADAHVNLGRLLQEAGQPGLAEAHYRLALSSSPAHATAWFNLGVSLEDLERPDEAIGAYEKAAEADPRYADAYFNLARLFERRGDTVQALRNLTTYRRLLRK